MGTSRLKVIMAERDIRLKELMAMTGLGRSTLSPIVNGSRPRLETAYIIADALNMHVDKVFPGYYAAKPKKMRKLD